MYIVKYLIPHGVFCKTSNYYYFVINSNKLLVILVLFKTDIEPRDIRKMCCL